MKTAFSLVEIIVGVGLTAIMLLAVTLYLVSSLRSTGVAGTKLKIKDEAEFLMTSMTRAVKFSRMINGCTATRLDLLDTDGSVLVYELVSGRIRASWTYPLPTPTVSVNLNTGSNNISFAAAPCSGSVFTCDAALRTVKICFIMTDSTVTENGSITLQGSATLLN